MRKLRTLSFLFGVGFVITMFTTVFAADNSGNSAPGNVPALSQSAADANAFPFPAITGPRVPPSAQSVVAPIPRTSVSKASRARFERRPGMGNTLVSQWSLEKDLPRELRAGGLNPSQRDDNQAKLTVKDAIFIAIRNNPELRADLLEPLASEETVRESNAAFDLNLNSQAGVVKDAAPAITNFNSVGEPTFSRKQYDWNLGVSKLLSTTNGSLSLSFENNHIESNARTWTINPSYNPFLGVSLSQPLLRNFGLKFATINVRIAQAGQAQAQYNFEQQLSDFVLRIATEYWNVVRAVENLQVNKGALRLAQDTVNQDLANLKMGMAARIDVQEAQSQAASWRAAVLAAQSAAATAKVILRQDVMLNPRHEFMPERIDPSDRPTDAEDFDLDEERSLEAAMENRPELGAMRESLRALLLQVRYARNQTLPQLNLGARVGLSSTAGALNCFHFHDVNLRNCIAASSHGTPTAGSTLPYGGGYGDALNRLWDFNFYNYAFVLHLEVPFSNDYAQAGLAQARILYDQQRLRYTDQVSKITVDVESALSNLTTTAERVHATAAATDYARAALGAEEARYRAGVADTHELLQYQQELIGALGSQVQAQLDLEIAKVAMKHAKGTLLKSLQINFVVDKNYATPWYARF